MTDMGHVADVGRAIADELEAEGLIPDGGIAFSVEHVTMARVSVLHADGTVEVSFAPYWSSTVNPGAHEEMARKLLDEAARRVGGSGA